MAFELHCLYWPNMPAEIVALHRACFEHIGVEVIYTNERIAHGEWIDRTIASRLDRLDAIGFIDIDCLAYSRSAIEDPLSFAVAAQSFVGLAQCANHFVTDHNVYAAPSFLIISRAAFLALKRPVMRMAFGVDAAQDLSLRAEAASFPYRVIHPYGFEAAPKGGPWRLANHGHYGIGTQYEGGIFHLFESRGQARIDLFRGVAEAILADRPQPATMPYMCHSLAFTDGVSKPKGPWISRAVRKLVRRV